MGSAAAATPYSLFPTIAVSRRHISSPGTCDCAQATPVRCEFDKANILTGARTRAPSTKTLGIRSAAAAKAPSPEESIAKVHVAKTYPTKVSVPATSVTKARRSAKAPVAKAPVAKTPVAKTPVAETPASPQVTRFLDPATMTPTQYMTYPRGTKPVMYLLEHEAYDKDLNLCVSYGKLLDVGLDGVMVQWVLYSTKIGVQMCADKLVVEPCLNMHKMLKNDKWVHVLRTDIPHDVIKVLDKVVKNAKRVK